MKLIRNGKLMKREYRGQRSLEAITDYVRELLRDPVKELETAEDVEKVDVSINLSVVKDLPNFISTIICHSAPGFNFNLHIF